METTPPPLLQSTAIPNDDDSPGPDVRAFLAGGALQAGLGCEGAGGVGPTHV